MPELTKKRQETTMLRMRTTLNIDAELLAEASSLTGVKRKADLVRMGLEALVAREAARRLAALGGSERRPKAGRRRRPGGRS